MAIECWIAVPQLVIFKFHQSYSKSYNMRQEIQSTCVPKDGKTGKE